MNDSYDKRLYYLYAVACCTALVPCVANLLWAFGILAPRPLGISFTLLDAIVLVVASGAVGVLVFAELCRLLVRYQKLIPVFDLVFGYPQIGMIGFAVFAYGFFVTLSSAYGDIGFLRGVSCVAFLCIGSFLMTLRFIMFPHYSEATKPVKPTGAGRLPLHPLPNHDILLLG